MHTKTLLLACLFAGAALTGCKKEDDPVDTNTARFTATINSQQEVPTNSSTATGAFTGTLDKSTRVLTYEVTYQGLTPTAGHLHRGPAGQNGPVVVDFGNTAVRTSPVRGTATLRQTLVDSLMNGQVYVNLHTTAFPGGEIRGNISMVR
jgi:hypothetical protein